MSPVRDELRFRLAGILGWGLVRMLYSTIRLIDVGRERHSDVRAEGSGVLYVLWHDHLLSSAYTHRYEDVVILVSEHADGEYITRILKKMRFSTARGSSTRGGVRGLKGLVRAAREGRDAAITTDGPRGPRHVVKEGAVVAAQLTGLPVIPLGAAASRSWVMDSWDRFQLPKPFSRVVLAHGEPIRVPRELDDDGRAAMVARMQEALEDATLEAETVLAGEEDR